jgi:hypothetical protein
LQEAEDARPPVQRWMRQNAVLRGVLALLLVLLLVLLCVVLQFYGGECPYNEDSRLATPLRAHGVYCRVVLTCVLLLVLLLILPVLLLVLPVSQFHGGECPYNEDSRLASTHPYGLMECDADCKCSKKASKVRRHLCKVGGSKSPDCALTPAR